MTKTREKTAYPAKRIAEVARQVSKPNDAFRPGDVVTIAADARLAGYDDNRIGLVIQRRGRTSLAVQWDDGTGGSYLAFDLEIVVRAGVN